MTSQPESHTGPVRRPLGELPVAVVLLIAGGGVAAIMLSHWRRGMFLVGLAALVAALLRLVLRSRDAGLLVVRSRAFDVLALTLMGAAVLVLTAVVPGQSG
ncbi:MAG: hypothetical protein QOF82_1054 [Frankiales bacterium]|nr:hypothetical protein [Frankiales bacterium]MDX6211967.1 hypothetical protein [Frankiales bacterium]MDX6222191.1 hypothetical protein [Frankiales bacterium]